jgi:hypothetical protein
MHKSPERDPPYATQIAENVFTLRVAANLLLPRSSSKEMAPKNSTRKGVCRQHGFLEFLGMFGSCVRLGKVVPSRSDPHNMQQEPTPTTGSGVSSNRNLILTLIAAGAAIAGVAGLALWFGGQAKIKRYVVSISLQNIRRFTDLDVIINQEAACLQESCGWKGGDPGRHAGR